MHAGGSFSFRGVNGDARRHPAAADAGIDGIAHGGFEHFQLARNVHGNFGLAAIDRAQFDGDFETVPGAFATPITRHGFHGGEDAENTHYKRINFDFVIVDKNTWIQG